MNDQDVSPRNEDHATSIVAGLPQHLPGPEDLQRDIRMQEPSAKEVFLAWEKLRVVYNLIVGLCVFLVPEPTPKAHLFWMLWLNIFFCSGSALE